MFDPDEHEKVVRAPQDFDNVPVAIANLQLQKVTGIIDAAARVRSCTRSTSTRWLGF